MLKKFKKTLAVICAAAICVSLTACHRPGETAVTVDGENFSSGFYSCAMLAADEEAMQKASKILEEAEVQKTNKNYLDTEIDGVKYTDWVKNRALEICKEFLAAKRLCEENKVETATYIENAKANAELYWQYGYEPYYTANGVGIESFKDYMAYSIYQSAYFDSVYGEKGKTPISEDEIAKHLHTNYAYVNVLTANLSELEDENITEVQDTMKGFADRINAGEAFAKIYAEVQEQEYTADETDFGTFSNSLAEIWSADGFQYESEYFTALKDIKEGEVAVVPYTNANQQEFILLILRADIMNEKNTQLSTLKSAARTDLKGDEMEKIIKEKAAKLELKETKSSTNQFKVADINYLEDAAK
ncbi:MAG: hypothetical protein KBS52_03360 [Clostridiales bacterium]|nr:hypothetical protein [Candidatus Equinaster intestinalis]